MASSASTFPWGPLLTEREAQRRGAGVEELDLERAVGDLPRLTDQLVQPRLRNRAVAFGVDVEAVRLARCRAAEPDAEPCGRAGRGRRQDEVQVACVEAVADAAARLVAHGVLPPERPVSFERPLVDVQ